MGHATGLCSLFVGCEKKTGPHSAAIKMLHRDDNNNARRYMVTTYLHGDCHQIAGWHLMTTSITRTNGVQA